MPPPDRLQAIYNRIPRVRGCKRGCSDCCGPVPVCAAEAARIASPQPLARWERGWITPVRGDCMSCAYASPMGCTIYETRPILCRLFGAVDHPGMTCPHGARAKRLLRNDEARQLIEEAEALR